jgi:hypothetical protein
MDTILAFEVLAMVGSPSPDQLPRWLAATTTPLSEMATLHPAFYDILHPHLLRGYEEAGCPYGPSEVGMWRWWEERASVDREKWVARHRAQFRAPNGVRPSDGAG